MASDRNFLTEVKSKLSENTRPWSLFFDTKEMSAPKGIDVVQDRLKKNVIFYAGNYALVFAGVLIFSLITSPLSAFALLAIAGLWFYFFVKTAGTPVTIAGRVLDDKAKGILLVVASVLLLLFTGAGSLIFYVVGFGGLLIIGHAAFRNPPAPIDEESTVVDRFLRGAGR
mmetsp:Transcript_4761/g.7402  ORF Transcript_4761/g.7402 Transcript_4761/m.7402 type:complete len:170 (+) Transcript_4761:75-584(+)